MALHGTYTKRFGVAGVNRKVMRGHLEGRQHNLKHKESEEMECVECHLPHEEFDPKDTCTDCHDEEDEELSNFYSVRLDRYLNMSSLDIEP